MMPRYLPFLAVLFLLPVTVSAQVPTPPATGKEQGAATYDPVTGFYTAPAPDREPEYRVGQKFFNFDAELLSSDKVGRHHLALQVFTVKEYDLMIPEPANFNPDLYGTTLVFEKTPEFGTVEFGTSTAGYGRAIDDLPGLYPLVDDANVRFLQKKYVGKTVYPYGSTTLTGVPRNPDAEIALQYDGNAPLRIRRIIRIRSARAVQIGLGGASGAAYLRAQPVGSTHSPLVVIFEPTRTAKPIGARTVGLSRKESDTPDLLGKLPGYCVGFYVYLFDRWDFECAFSLVGPRQIAQTAPAALRDAFLRGKLKPGMSAEMVARLRGFPPGFRTRASLLEEVRPDSWVTWKYPTVPPYHVDIEFNRGELHSWGEHQPSALSTRDH